MISPRPWPRRAPLAAKLSAIALAIALAVAFFALAPAAALAAPPPPRPQLTEKPSGFWTSTRPAKGGAYRYRMLGIGVVIAAATGYTMLRVIRKHGARTPAAVTTKR